MYMETMNTSYEYFLNNNMFELLINAKNMF